MPVRLPAAAPGKPPFARFVVWGLCLGPWHFVFATLYGQWCWSESCLVLVLVLLHVDESGLSDGTTSSGVLVSWMLPVRLMCFFGAVSLVGRSSTSWCQGPPKRLSRGAGRPMGPSTPLCFSQSCAVFVLLSCLNLQIVMILQSLLLWDALLSFLVLRVSGRCWFFVLVLSSPISFLPPPPHFLFLHTIVFWAFSRVRANLASYLFFHSVMFFFIIFSLPSPKRYNSG